MGQELMTKEERMPHVGTNQYQPIPTPDDLEPVELSGNARQIFLKRYVQSGETPEQAVWRVASFVAMARSEEFGPPLQRARRYYDLLRQFIFVPNSPTWSGAGTPLGQLAACFVLPLEDDLGKESSGIFATLKNAALIQQTGGGLGFNFGKLRPKGSTIKSSGGEASGPLSFLRVYDAAFGSIAQGGTRRGANMGVMPIDHPDIEEFIALKHTEGDISNFNISVAMTDEFFAILGETQDDEIVIKLQTGDTIVVGFEETLEIDGKLVTGRELLNKRETI